MKIDLKWFTLLRLNQCQNFTWPCISVNLPVGLGANLTRTDWRFEELQKCRPKTLENISKQFILKDNNTLHRNILTKSNSLLGTQCCQINCHNGYANCLMKNIIIPNYFKQEIGFTYEKIMIVVERKANRIKA